MCHCHRERGPQRPHIRLIIYKNTISPTVSVYAAHRFGLPNHQDSLQGWIPGCDTFILAKRTSSFGGLFAMHFYSYAIDEVMYKHSIRMFEMRLLEGS